MQRTTITEICFSRGSTKSAERARWMNPICKLVEKPPIPTGADRFAWVWSQYSESYRNGTGLGISGLPCIVPWLLENCLVGWQVIVGTSEVQEYEGRIFPYSRTPQ